MEFCRCFGLSSLQIVLKDLSISEFKTLLSYLNSPSDAHLIDSIANEFDMLIDLLENKCVTMTNSAPLANELGFPNPRLFDKYLRDWEASQKGVKVLTKFRHPAEWFEEVKTRLNELPKTLMQSVIVNGKPVKLTDEEFEVLKFYYKKLNKIKAYRNAISISTFKQVEVFGYPLHRLLKKEKMAISFQIFSKYADVQSTLRREDLLPFLKKYLEDCKKIIELSQTQETREESDYLDPSLSVDERMSILSETGNVNFRLDQKETYFAREILNSNVNIRYSQDVKTISEIMSLCRVTLEDCNYAFKQDFKSEEEWNEVFDSLALKGLVGLNFEVEEFFKDFLKYVTLKVPTKIVVSKDSALFECTVYLYMDIQSKLRRLSGE